MKIVCRQDHWPAKKVGVFKKRIEPSEKIHGLTRGKVYDAAVIERHSGGGQYAGVSLRDCRFFIFNDNGEWEHYHVRLFELAI